jgi:hypothetical protein
MSNRSLFELLLPVLPGVAAAIIADEQVIEVR